MNFNSQIFIFVFLPLMLAGYYFLCRFQTKNLTKLWIFAGSIFFYAYQRPAYLILLLASIFLNYGIYLCQKNVRNEKVQNLVLAIGICLNLSIIFYFKYFNFTMQNFAGLFHFDYVEKEIFLPLGISFFTFQQIAFLVDNRRDALEGRLDHYSLIDYGVFVSFFPQLVAGPIVLHSVIIPQLGDAARRKWNSERFVCGVRYFVLGLAKKTLLADRFGRLADAGYAWGATLDSFGAVLTILAYTFQIYFDFSGYSDMAIGLGKMFGIDLPINFDSPYKAKTIAEFWKRWHITMTGFFTRYLYIPLGGSRKGIPRTYINIMIVFALSGLWHGASWNFVVWGLLHGALLVCYRIFRGYIDKIPGGVNKACTFLAVNLAWIFFRSESFGEVFRKFKALLAGGFGGDHSFLYDAFFGDGFRLVTVNLGLAEGISKALPIVFTLFFYLAAFWIVFKAKSSHEIAGNTVIAKGEGFLYGLILVLSIMTLMNVSSFLYFNF